MARKLVRVESQNFLGFGCSGDAVAVSFAS